MRRSMVRHGVRVLVVAVIAIVASGHVGTFDAFFAGKAGPYDVQATVRQPGVIPGLAQISIRVGGTGVRRVTAQAVPAQLGLRGAPAPDVARAVDGVPGLYSAQLWLMTGGSYAIIVGVEGTLGRGRVVIPVTAVATQRKPMIPGLGWVLAGLGLFLTVGALTIVRAAAAESTLPPGEEPDGRRRWRGRGAAVAAAGIIGLLVMGGWNWWNSVDQGYARRLYRPMHSAATVQASASGRTLRLAVDDDRWRRWWTSPVPDHGKMMHLILVRVPAMDAFAHLHPHMTGSAAFDVALGSTPAGRYRYYGDVVHETGALETLTGFVDLPDPVATDALGDGDDVVDVRGPAGGDSVAVGDGTLVIWHRPRVLTTRSDETLWFTVLDADAKPAELEPYLGMPAHAIIARDDGSVFVHLHGSGSFAMASLEAIEAIQRGDTLPRVRLDAFARPIVRQADSTAMRRAMPRWRGDSLAFPFAFPSPGRYRVWVQFRHNGVIRTAAWDASVSDSTSR